MGEITGPERQEVLTNLVNDLGNLRDAILRGEHGGTVESLAVVRRLKGILEVSEELVALAAIDRMPMAKIGAEIDRSETSVPMMLARTKRLAPYAERTEHGTGVRISKRSLGAAEYDLLNGEMVSPGE